MIYIIVLIYTLFLFFRYNVGKKKKGEKFHYYFLLFIVICITGFSYRLGMDTIGYSENFERLDDFNTVIHHLNGYRYEPAFVLLLSLCKSIWNDFAMVQIVVALFVNTTIFWFAKKHSNYYFLAIFLFFIYDFWNFNFEIKRESIAVSFFLLGIHHLLKEKVVAKDYIVYYIFSAFCFAFHHFGILTIFFPLLMRIRMNKVYYTAFIIIFLVSLFGSMFLKDTLVAINQLMALYTGEDITTYMESGKYGEGSFYTINGLITALVIPLYIVYSIKDRIDKKILALTLFTFIISLLSSQVFIIYRLQNYFCMFLFITYSRFAEVSCSSRSGRASINRLILIFVIFVVMYGKCHKSQYIRYAPYSSIFTKEINREREAEFDRLATEYLYY